MQQLGDVLLFVIMLECDEHCGQIPQQTELSRDAATRTKRQAQDAAEADKTHVTIRHSVIYMMPIHKHNTWKQYMNERKSTQVTAINVTDGAYCSRLYDLYFLLVGGVDDAMDEGAAVETSAVQNRFQAYFD